MTTAAHEIESYCTQRCGERPNHALQRNPAIPLWLQSTARRTGSLGLGR